MATRQQQKIARIVKTIERLVEQIRRKDQKQCARLEIEYTDPMAEYLIETEPKKMWGNSQADADTNPVLVQLRFDGDTYEYFSYNGSMQCEGIEKLAKMLKKIGCSYEYQDGCSIDIYQD